MYDINFYMMSYPIVKMIENGKKFSMEELFNLFESFRSKNPFVYNIETTNACNMRCKMCPRTTRMTRDITFLDLDNIENIVSQLKPHTKELWSDWEVFCTKTYGIAPNDNPSENHFFLYIKEMKQQYASLIVFQKLTIHSWFL